MKKLYDEPVIEIRNYVLPPSDIVMTSDIIEGDGDNGSDLGDGDDFDYFS